MVIHRTITLRDLYPILREAGELSAVILLVVSLAGIFAFSLSTLGVIDPVAKAIVDSGLGEYGVMALLILLLITVGMFLEDRKSTRLNSSHLVISYAVFCLKK